LKQIASGIIRINQEREVIKMDMIQPLIDAVINGDEDKVKVIVLEGITKGEKAADIMNKGLIAAMDVVGEKMEAEDMFIPEVLMSARAMSAGVQVLQPHLTKDEAQGLGIVVIGSVQGDLHDIGKNLVKLLMEGAGFSVIDLGTDVNPEKFIEAVRDNNADIVGMSALLTTTMLMMKNVIEALESESLRDQVKVLVGGAPVTKEYAEEIGADAYGADAGSAVRIAKSLLSAK
jgi:5-methyltetrahydrofolate--homocysteine methyltransferase